MVGRHRLVNTRVSTQATRPQNLPHQIYCTTIAIFREISYPQIFSIRRHSSLHWLTPPSLGQILILASYWLCTVLFLTSNAIVHDAYYWERIGFRAAWISVTQVPLVYLLSGKFSIATYLLGSSYDRLNWVHRWVSRTLFVTVTIHGGFFLTEWVRADFVVWELEMMPMVKYGIGAWAVLLWTLISSLAPLRKMAHQIFVLQHLAAAAVFLWLLHVHVPSYATYNVWWAVALLALDTVMHACLTAYRNISSKVARSGRHVGIIGRKRLGYRADVQAFPGDVVTITIHDTDFAWKAGQHVRLWCPSIWPLGAHPFTISNIPTSGQDRHSSAKDKKSIQLFIRAKSGFTRRLHRQASDSIQLVNSPLSYDVTRTVTKTVFLTGPYGFPPTPNGYHTVVLIAASTGATFTLALLDSILSDPSCVRRVDFTLIVRHASHANAFLPRLIRAGLHANSARSVEIHLTVAVTQDDNTYLNTEAGISKLSNETGHVTGDPAAFVEESSENRSVASCSEAEPGISEKSSMLYGSAAGLTDFPPSTKQPRFSELSFSDLENGSFVESETADSQSSHFHSCARPRFVRGPRPCIRDIIRQPVEAAAGETLVVACGAGTLTSDVRNAVAWLSDERAVHKGTGAQGIRCWVEGNGY